MRSRFRWDDGSWRSSRPLHPLAVLRLQMPLLRLQQPCPRVDRPGRNGARRCSPTSLMRRAQTPGRRLGSIFFGGGTPSLMPPATVAALIEAAERPLGLRARDRDHARGQPLLGRGGALRRPRRGRRQPRLARPAVARRRALRFLGRAHDVAEGLAALDTAQARLRPGQLRPDLRLPGQTRRRWEAELARALAFGTGHLSLYQLTIEPGTRFAAHGGARAS